MCILKPLPPWAFMFLYGSSFLRPKSRTSEHFLVPAPTSHSSLSWSKFLFHPRWGCRLGLIWWLRGDALQFLAWSRCIPTRASFGGNVEFPGRPTIPPPPCFTSICNRLGCDRPYASLHYVIKPGSMPFFSFICALPRRYKWAGATFAVFPAWVHPSN